MIGGFDLIAFIYKPIKLGRKSFIKLFIFIFSLRVRENLDFLTVLPS